jgi:hypothetical protein
MNVYMQGDIFYAARKLIEKSPDPVPATTGDPIIDDSDRPHGTSYKPSVVNFVVQSTHCFPENPHGKCHENDIFQF